MARHPGQAMACQLIRRALQPQKQLFITRDVLSEAGRAQRKVFSIQQTERVCPCCVLYTHSRAAKRPLAASLPATPALGHRRCLIVSGFSAGLQTTLRCFQLLTGKKRIQLRPPSNSDACSQGFARPHMRCHGKNCNSRIYGGVTHFPHIHQQSRQDSVHQSLIPPINQDQHFHQIGFRPHTGENRPAGSY